MKQTTPYFRKLIVVLSAALVLGGSGCGTQDDDDQTSGGAAPPTTTTGGPTGTGDADRGPVEIGPRSRHYTCSPAARNAPDLKMDLYVSADGSQAVLGGEVGGIVFDIADQGTNRNNLNADTMVDFQRVNANNDDGLRVSRALINGSDAGKADIRGTDFSCGIVNP